MRTIASLFRSSPFAPLQTHMEQVAECVSDLQLLYDAYTVQDYDKIEQLAKQISKKEHMADLTKNEIRNNLPRGIFLAINRADLLDILSLQDTIADKAEDVAILFTMKKLEPIDGLDQELKTFVEKNIQSVKEVHLILKQLDELLETSFSGREAKLVTEMVDNISLIEHEVDLIQVDLLRKLFMHETEIPYSSFYLWTNIFKTLAGLSNTAEKLANRVRMVLDID